MTTRLTNLIVRTGWDDRRVAFGRKKTDADAERETQVDQLIVLLLGATVDAAVELQRDQLRAEADAGVSLGQRLLREREPRLPRDQPRAERLHLDDRVGQSHPLLLYAQVNELGSKRDAKKACLRLYRAGFVTIDPFDDVRLTPAGYEWYREHRDELPEPGLPVRLNQGT
jgi:hypothetical protein